MEDIVSLDIQDSNELLFKIKIEGATKGSTARVRMVCECDDVSYMFPGRPMKEGNDLVQFMVPKLVNKVDPGMYEARVEVMVENRYFIPVKFNVEFKDSLTVVGECIKISGPEQKDLDLLGEDLNVDAIEAPVNLTQLRKFQNEAILEKVKKAESVVQKKLEGQSVQNKIVNESKKDIKPSDSFVAKSDKKIGEKSLRQIANLLISKKL